MRQTALNMVYDLAKRDPRVVFIGSDLGAGTLDKFKAEMPERFLMDGVSEALLVGLSAGLALEGKIPYFNTITTFISRRAYEQVVLDLCLHKANVRLLGSGGGLVYAPLGPTHLAIEDMAILRTVPNLCIVVPADAEEMKRVMEASLNYQGPMYIRFAKGGETVVSNPELPFEIGKGYVYRPGKDAIIISTGITLQLALEAHQELSKEGISAKVLHLPTLKPLDIETIKSSIGPVKAVVTVEEGVIAGGLGSMIAEIIAETEFSTPKRLKRIGIADEFPEHYGSQDALLKHYGISTEQIVLAVKNLL